MPKPKTKPKPKTAKRVLVPKLPGRPLDPPLHTLTADVLAGTFGLSVRALGKATGLDHSQVYKYFTPGPSFSLIMPSLPKARLICNVLGVPLDNTRFMAELEPELRGGKRKH